MLQKALVTPKNLGEGRLPGFQENTIHYSLGCVYEYLGLSEKAIDHFHVASQGTEPPANALFYNDQPLETLFYQGLAWVKLDNVRQANHLFNKLIQYGRQHIFEKVTCEYFAVSLPDFLIFEEDLKKRHQIHCHYIMGLGYLGLQKFKQAQKQFFRVLNLDASHQGAIVHLEMCR